MHCQLVEKPFSFQQFIFAAKHKISFFVVPCKCSIHAILLSLFFSEAKLSHYIGETELCLCRPWNQGCLPISEWLPASKIDLVVGPENVEIKWRGKNSTNSIDIDPCRCLKRNKILLLIYFSCGRKLILKKVRILKVDQTMKLSVSGTKMNKNWLGRK